MRFPGFEDEWEKKKLGEICKIYDGTHQTPKYVQKGIPFYSVEHITADNFKNTKYISNEVYEKETKRVKIEKGDILMTRIGSIGVSKYINWDVKASFYVSVALIKQSSKINAEYLSHFISSRFFQNELWTRTIHVAFPKKINLGEIGSCKVFFPSPQEQQQIATLFSKVDARISTQSKTILRLESLIKGLAQKIFSQETRFKDDAGNDFPEWEKRKLGDLGEIITGKTPKTSDKDLWDGDIDFITPTDIFDDKKYQRLVSRTVQKINKMKILPIGTIVYTCIASIGKIAITAKPSITNQQINSLTVKKEYSNEFIYYALKCMTPKIKTKQANTTLPIINKTEFSKFKLFIPCKQEQIKIANFLSALDEKIEKEREILAQYEQQKKYLLQNMFI